jgi:hypothetical protein
LVAAAALAGGAWLLTHKFELQGLDNLRLTPKTPISADGAPAVTVPEAKPSGTVRIASFSLQGFDEAHVNNPRVLETLVKLIRRFEVVAIQGIRAPSQEALARLIDALNADAREYDTLVSPPVGRFAGQEQYAFLFDTERVEVDRSESYVVNDPDDLLHREPWVAWFRVRGPRPDTAFTFTLVNVSVDPQRVDQELDVLADVFTKVRHDGRGEDDVILVGDFQVGDQHVGRLTEQPRIVWVISGAPTTTRGDAQCDNLVFDQRATNEFTGRVGVCDFLREFNLTLDNALEVSDHLPVWAEFTAREGTR